MKMPVEKIWDPLRRRMVPETPEEKVRQWFITVLAQDMKVPLHMMRSEVAFTFGDKHFQADIVIYDRKASPVAVVECKRPDVPLDRKVLEQALRYNMALNVKYIFITNGNGTHVCGPEGFMAKLPSYEEMLSAVQD